MQNGQSTNQRYRKSMPEAGQASGTDGQSWRTFWGGPHSIYVNARHAEVHYQRLADDLIGMLQSRARPRVLDWGCGDALNAPRVAAHCGELLLYDAVPAVQARIAGRFAGIQAIKVLGDSDWRALPAGSIDVVIFNSVAQYLGREDLAALLDDFRRVVAPGGEVILADIIPPATGVLPDVLSLLRSGARHGFLLAACVGLARTFFSEYRSVRSRAGFATYSQSEFLSLLGAHGFMAERLQSNVGFNSQRMTFRARPRA